MHWTIRRGKKKVKIAQDNPAWDLSVSVNTYVRIAFADAPCVVHVNDTKILIKHSGVIAWGGGFPRKLVKFPLLKPKGQEQD